MRMTIFTGENFHIWGLTGLLKILPSAAYSFKGSFDTAHPQALDEMEWQQVTQIYKAALLEVQKEE